MAKVFDATTFPVRRQDAALRPRHTAVVRITHWINLFAFAGLVTSSVAILMAHPRLYWGETGGFGSPALIEIPLPLNLDQSGWGRSLHFLSAWICILNGGLYIIFGAVSHHFHLMLPGRRLRRPQRRGGAEPALYSRMQAWTYLGVVFLLFPLMITTGLAMSPAVSAAAPIFVDFFGGYQSARTIHFFVTTSLLLFFIGHLVMISRAGFLTRTRAMITGYLNSPEKRNA